MTHSLEEWDNPVNKTFFICPVCGHVFPLCILGDMFVCFYCMRQIILEPDDPEEFEDGGTGILSNILNILANFFRKK